MFSNQAMFSVLVGLSVLLSQTFGEPPADAGKGPAGYRPERPNDPYVPGYRPGDPFEESPPVVPLKRFRGGSGFDFIQVNVSLSGSNIPGDAANEPSIAIDPTDPDRIVIGWRQFDSVKSDFRQAGRAYSSDGGISWTYPGVLQREEFASDPVLDSDSDGNFYYYSLQPERGPGDWACYMYKSTNGGATFPGMGVYAYGGDKAWMAIDKTGGVGDGNIYINWSENAACCGPNNRFTRSVDGGLTYLPPVAVPGSTFAGTMSVASDGTLYMVSGSGFDGNVDVRRSINARVPGQTPSFNLATEAYIGGVTTFGAVNPDGLLGQMWVATDHSHGPTGGSIHVCGSVQPLDGSGDPLDVLFISSSNGGVDWTKPQRINDDPRGNGAYQWFGTMSVAPNGRIDVIWNDTREDSSNNMSQVYYSFSLDGGRMWSRNIAATRAFDHRLGYPQQQKLGDYYHMISDDETAHLAFAATFNDEQDVYYMRVSQLLERCPLSNAENLRGIDCNHNGRGDECDIELGISDDEDHNFIPDECEGDFDDDGINDGVDPDIDGDGIGNGPDICDFTPPGVPIRGDGRSFGDLNRDCATDLLDYSLFDRCIAVGGPDVNLSEPLRFCVLHFDADGDMDSDLRDVARFQNAFTNPAN